jgi:hypothetical protein
MSFRIAMDMGGRVAAIASFIANVPTDNASFKPLQRRVPVLMCNGTDDPLMPWLGEPGALRSAADSVIWWVQQNGANPIPGPQLDYPDLRTDDGCRIYRNDYPALPGGAPVSFLRTQGGGHNMPSIAYYGTAPLALQRIAGPQCGDVEAADLVWEFFQAHEVPLEPKLSFEMVETQEAGQLVRVNFTGGYPGGKVTVEGSATLDSGSGWSALITEELGDVGEMEIKEFVLPTGRHFLRAKTQPLGR